MADHQKPQFQWWKLFAWMVGTPPLMVGTLYLTGRSLPNREHLDEYTYRHAWITFLIGMAITGAIVYLMNLSQARRAYDRLQSSATISDSDISH